MAVQKLPAAGQDRGSTDRLNGQAAEDRNGDYTLIVADRRVEEASRRVAEQIRVVAEIEAAGDPSERATATLQELEQALTLVTEQRDAARHEAADPQTHESEAG